MILRGDFVDRFYDNSANHLGFVYNNKNFISPATERVNPLPGKQGKSFKLATIYVQPQVYKGISNPTDSLKQGTAFAELYSPFAGKGGIR